MATMLQANNIISEYYDYAASQLQSSRPPPSQNRINQIQRPPRNDTIKVNCDASFNYAVKKGCAGIFARDKNGLILFGITKCFEASSPLTAEALALREVAVVAFNFGVTNVILENDNWDLVQACRGEIKIGEIHNLVQDIVQLKEQFLSCGVTWVAREGNKVAHQITCLKMQDVLPIHWRWSHPDSLQNLINRDRELIRVDNTSYLELVLEEREFGHYLQPNLYCTASGRFGETSGG